MPRHGRCNCPEVPYWTWSPTRAEPVHDGSYRNGLPRHQRPSLGSWYCGTHRPICSLGYCFACDCRLEPDGTVVPMVRAETVTA